MNSVLPHYGATLERPSAMVLSQTLTQRRPSVRDDAVVEDVILEMPQDSVARPLPAPPTLDMRSFSRKLTIYGKEFFSNEYGPANAAVLLGIAGLGMTNGGYMVLLKNLGEEGSSLPVFGFMGLTALSMILSGVSKTYTSHQRDNQDLVLIDHFQDTTAADYCKYLVRCGYATAATNASLLVGTAAYTKGMVSSESLLALSIIAKSVEACLKGVELGYWNCIKTHLGDEQSLQYQRSLNRTIVGLESITQAVAFNVVTVGTYYAITLNHSYDATMNAIMLSLLVGCAIIASSNSHFTMLEKRLS